MSDGQSTFPRETIHEANKLHKVGMEIFSVGVTYRMDRVELSRIASAPTRDHLSLMTDGRALGHILDLLTQTECNNLIEATEPTDCVNGPVDIAVVLDVSSSIWGEDFKRMIKFVQKMAYKLDVGGDVRISALSYSDKVHPLFDFDDYLDSNGLSTEIGYTYKYNGVTYTAAALRYLRNKMFLPSKGHRKGVRKVAIVISDGKSTTPKETFYEVEELHKQNIEIFAIGVTHQMDRYELQRIASQPTKDHMFLMGRDDAIDFLEKTLMASCNLPFTETTDIVTIDECSKGPVDIYVILDVSSSIWGEDFKKMIKFVQKFAATFDVGGDVRIGAISFSDKVHKLFDLDDHLSPQSLIKEIGYTYKYNGVTYTGPALRYLRQHAFQESRGARPGVKKAVMIISDGKSTIPKETYAEAELVHQAGIEVYSIGVTYKMDRYELARIASQPTKDHLLLMGTDNILEHLKKQLLSNCDVGEVKECKDKPIDMIIALDTSGNIGYDDFRKELEFGQNLVRAFSVSKNTRIGAVTFGRAVYPKFDLIKYTLTEAMAKEIEFTYKRNGVTNIDEVLQYIRGNSFLRSNGGRQDSVKSIVLITDGKSINPGATLREAQMLRSAGIKLFTVGISRNMDTAELTRIAATPSEEHFLTMSNQASIPLLKDRLTKSSCEDTPPFDDTDCSIPQADLVFILDESDSIWPLNFTKQLDFVKTFVKRLDIGRDAVQVGMVTFSNHSKLRFQLDDHKNKDELLRAIGQIQQTGGHTNTGDALNTARTYSFTQRHGARGGQVPKIAIVITDGNSQSPDRTLHEAQLTKKAGITIFAIGVGRRVSYRELNNIASGSSRIFFVDEYAKLVNIERELSFKTCQVSPHLNAKKLKPRTQSENRT